MKPELKLMIEILLVTHADAQEHGAMGWLALDVAVWMTDLAATELEASLPEPELRKIYALSQLIDTLSKSLRSTGGSSI